jgi:methionyl-tRNA formyltransferase
MRLIMLGTGPFAVPTFRALYEAGHALAALVTAPVRMHRGKPVEPISSIRDIAREHGTAIFDPENVNAPESVERLRSYGVDLLVACDYGQILSSDALAAARLGGVNLHAALLPKYRGAAPINWAVYHGETETGVTVIHMTPKLDAGPCIAQARTWIDAEETAGELEVRLAELGAPLVCEAIEGLGSGRVKPLPQDPKLTCRAPRLKKTDGRIDWTRTALAIKNQIRAMEPWPKSYTFWRRAQGSAVRLILGPVEVIEVGMKNVVPGMVLEAHGERLTIAAGHDAVAPRSIQPAGKRAMGIGEFLRGHAVRVGDVFGDEGGIGD